ncbi:unnamed protein product [Parascedosporium putredinis]|uniref:Protein BTN n=1 Tax=Parascedosporium putredinis TaxID=1442378 RepID=A0A9P1GZW8_9PEZI|nr:unnamed protein product [Parascedosporium putredinis]CAI7992123.1 unnamed protein product [Parascedosporium putredinis]
MLLVAITPSHKSVATKLVGVMLASLSSGGGELSFLGLTHYYGHMSLAGWGSGTGAAGLVGAGLYVMMTDWIGFSVRTTLLFSAALPSILFVSFFFILPHGPLRTGVQPKDYDALPERDLEEDEVDNLPQSAASSALLAPGPSVAATAYSTHSPQQGLTFKAHLRRTKALFELREFYPFYGFLYQLGVFISRSSTPFIRIRRLYLPSFFQLGNLVILFLHAMFFFIPSVYIVFIIIFWEGLLGGGVYVNCFANILEEVPTQDREFSLGATSVSDSGGICIAGLISIFIETRLCDWQVGQGRDWCRNIKVSRD